MDTTTFIQHKLHPIAISMGGLKDWPTLFPGGIDALSRYSSLAIITDEHVYALHAAAMKDTLQRYELPAHFLVIPPGESHKSIFTATACWEGLLERGFDREGLVIAMGGGTVTDLAGFVASTYMRGVDTLNIPTSLMGMVDAAIGGKTGVNSPAGKTVIGTFHHPISVIIDPTFLATQDPSALLSGVAEMIKYAVIGNEKLLSWLKDHDAATLCADPTLLAEPIAYSCQMKLDIAGSDERDRTAKRALLNFGHTFAHALETLSRYTTYLHGEAVAIGMSCAAHLSYHMGHVEEGFIREIDGLCAQYRLPYTLPSMPLEPFIAAMQRDKKTLRHTPTYVISKGIGRVEITREVSSEQVLAALTHKVEYDKAHASLSALSGLPHGSPYG